MFKIVLVFLTFAGVLSACANRDVDPVLVKKVKEMNPCGGMGSVDSVLTDEVANACLMKFNGILQREYVSWHTENPNLAGSVVLEVQVDGAGNVLNVRPTGKGTMSSMFSKRVAKFVGAYALLPPSSAGWSGVHTFDFSPPTALSSSSGERPWPAENVATKLPAVGKYRNDRGCTGSHSAVLEDEVVQSCIEKYNGVLQAEYQRWLRSNPTLRGSLVVEIEVDKDGNIVEATVMPDPEIGERFGERVVEMLKGRVKMPKSSSGWKNKYTLNFYPS